MIIHYSTHPQGENLHPTLEECLRVWFSQIPYKTYLRNMPHRVAVYQFRDGVRVGALVIRKLEYLTILGHWEAV